MARPPLDENQQVVFQVLLKNKSMPFLELTSLIDFDDNILAQILSQLEEKELVKITNRGNLLEEIVTVKEKAFAA